MPQSQDVPPLEDETAEDTSHNHNRTDDLNHEVAALQTFVDHGCDRFRES
jgi:hypothetical protein